jgi:hypothetical protein
MHYIKFTHDASTSEDPPQQFAAGRVYALREDSCARWVHRRVAVPATQGEFEAQSVGDGAVVGDVETLADAEPEAPAAKRSPSIKPRAKAAAK